jgi:TonB-linked SusC/RagA family outer membrane protein
MAPFLYTIRKRPDGFAPLMFALFLALVVCCSLPVFAQQAATFQGKITDERTGETIPGANVFLAETKYGAASNFEGRYSFSVPAADANGQAVVLTVRFVGFKQMVLKLKLTPGVHSNDFAMSEDVLGLQEVIVTGVVGGTYKERLAFSAETVSKTQLEQVPATTAEQAIRGKVSGVHIMKNSGQPGTAATVQIRGAKSINLGNDPLYIVDGVIADNGTVNLDAANIENVEVVKGAAGASLYGSRAQNGVVQITTARGNTLATGVTRINFRNEYGMSDIERSVALSQAHNYLYDASRVDSPWVNYTGVHVARSARVADTTWRNANYNPSFKDKPYVGTMHDQVKEFFNPGNYYENLLSISHRWSTTNFFFAASNRKEAGVIEGNDGFGMQTFRLNLDHQFIRGVDLSFSGLHTTSMRNNIPGNPLFTLTFMPPDVDLRSPNSDGTPFILQPEPQNNEANPLYQINNLTNYTKTKRTMGNVLVRYKPLDFFNMEANLSYDRRDDNASSITPKGYKTLNPVGVSTGSRSFTNSGWQSINGSLLASFDQNFGDLSVRAKFSYQILDQLSRSEGESGQNFAVNVLQTLSLTTQNWSVSSSETRIKGESYFFITGLDYAGKYMVDAVLRNDGSSLFGPNQRRQWYYRVSGAYRIGQESWWPFSDFMRDFKLRYSLGTAGALPGFSYQYETWSVSSGSISKGQLGNGDLRPEFSKEQEFGLEFSLLDRYLLEFTYAPTVTKDQVINVPLLSYYGFSSQYQNAGTLESKSYEFSLKGSVFQSGNMSLSFQFNADKFKQQITEYNRPPIRTGGTQNTNPFYLRSGEVLGSIYGTKWIKSTDDLPDQVKPYANRFAVNDDGYLVYVGAGNTWQDGWGKKLWGRRDTVFSGYSYFAKTGIYVYKWGEPIKYQSPDSLLGTVVPLGNTVPDVNLALSSTFRWGKFTVYALFDAQIGGMIYNLTRQWAYRDNASGDNDQMGKSNETKKPVQYYQTLYDVAGVSNHFLEEGTFVKLRELSIRYSFERGDLAPFFGEFFNRITVGLIGRNLKTWTNYKSYDPEVGDVTQRFDGHGYPNFRQVTGSLEIEF